jgi:hypothetical protein
MVACRLGRVNMFQQIFSFAQILGYAALVVSLLGYQAKSQRRLFGVNLASDITWGMHYLALGGFMPAFAVAISALRTTLAVFLFPEHKKLVAGAAFIVISGICILTNSDGPQGYLVIATAAVYSTCVAFHESYAVSRALMALGLILWIAIGALYGSIGEVVSSAISLGSLVIGVLRHNWSSLRLRSLRAPNEVVSAVDQ